MSCRHKAFCLLLKLFLWTVHAEHGYNVQGYQDIIVAGDLNCPPDTLEMNIFRALLPQLHDCWSHVHPKEPGFTSNAPDNTFTKTGKMHSLS